MKLRSVAFGLLLLPLGLAYLLVAYNFIVTSVSTGDLVTFVMLLFFLALGVVAASLGLNIVRTNRR